MKSRLMKSRLEFGAVVVSQCEAECPLQTYSEDEANTYILRTALILRILILKNI